MQTGIIPVSVAFHEREWNRISGQWIPEQWSAYTLRTIKGQMVSVDGCQNSEEAIEKLLVAIRDTGFSGMIRVQACPAQST